MDAVPLYHIELVRDRSIPLTKLTSVEQYAEVFHTLLDKSPVEQMAVIHLDASKKVVGVEKVGLGSLTSVGVTMADIFRGAILASVPYIVLGHNHPSDDPTPSQQDWDLTTRAMDMGAQLGIMLLDHMVVAQDGTHVSMRTEDNKQTEGLLGSLMGLMDIMPPDMKQEMERKLLNRGIDPKSLSRNQFVDPLYDLDPAYVRKPNKAVTNLGDLLLPLLNGKRR